MTPGVDQEFFFRKVSETTAALKLLDSMSPAHVQMAKNYFKRYGMKPFPVNFFGGWGSVLATHYAEQKLLLDIPGMEYSDCVTDRFFFLEIIISDF